MPIIPPPQIIRSKRRTLTLQILPNATMVVKAPLQMSLSEINRFLEKHQEWINKKTANIKPKLVNSQYQEGGEFLYLGKTYKLKAGNYQTISFHDEHLLFPQHLMFRAQKELNRWYIKQAEKVIRQQVEIYAKQMNLNYKSISFKDTKSRWGACTHDNRLQFNWKLIMTPLMVLNYVVIHELVHTIEKNHSWSFWNKVRYANPSYKQQIKWLKNYGNSLSV